MDPIEYFAHNQAAAQHAPRSSPQSGSWMPHQSTYTSPFAPSGLPAPPPMGQMSHHNGLMFTPAPYMQYQLTNPVHLTQSAEFLYTTGVAVGPPRLLPRQRMPGAYRMPTLMYSWQMGVNANNAAMLPAMSLDNTNAAQATPFAAGPRGPTSPQAPEFTFGQSALNSSANSLSHPVGINYWANHHSQGLLLHPPTGTQLPTTTTTTTEPSTGRTHSRNPSLGQPQTLQASRPHRSRVPTHAHPDRLYAARASSFSSTNPHERRRNNHTRNRRSMSDRSVTSEHNQDSTVGYSPSILSLPSLRRRAESMSETDGELDDDAEQQMMQEFRGSLSCKMVASKAALASLESVRINDLPENERACVICYNDFGAESPEGFKEAPLRLPKCKHVFGDHCIKKWFEDSDNCPYCRDKLPSERKHFATSHRVFMNMMRYGTWRGVPREISEDILRRMVTGDAVPVARVELVSAQAAQAAQTTTQTTPATPAVQPVERRSLPDSNDDDGQPPRTRQRLSDSAWTSPRRDMPSSLVSNTHAGMTIQPINQAATPITSQSPHRQTALTPQSPNASIENRRFSTPRRRSLSTAVTQSPQSPSSNVGRIRTRSSRGTAMEPVSATQQGNQAPVPESSIRPAAGTLPLSASTIPSSSPWHSLRTTSATR